VSVATSAEHKWLGQTT